MRLILSFRAAVKTLDIDFSRSALAWSHALPLHADDRRHRIKLFRQHAPAVKTVARPSRPTQSAAKRVSPLNVTWTPPRKRDHIAELQFFGQQPVKLLIAKRAIRHDHHLRFRRYGRPLRPGSAVPTLPQTSRRLAMYHFPHSGFSPMSRRRSHAGC